MLTKLKEIAARFTGRTTLFCSFFFVTGNLLHLLHRLDSSYIAFMGTLMGFVVGHATQENYFQSKNTENVQPTQQNGQNGQ